jgi:hypothetical protein
LCGLALCGVIAAVEPLRSLFELTPLRWFETLLLGGLVAVGAALLCTIWVNVFGIHPGSRASTGGLSF